MNKITCKTCKGQGTIESPKSYTDCDLMVCPNCRGEGLIRDTKFSNVWKKEEKLDHNVNIDYLQGLIEEILKYKEYTLNAPVQEIIHLATDAMKVIEEMKG